MRYLLQKVTILWRKQNWDWGRNLQIYVRIRLYQKFANTSVRKM